MGNKSEPPPNPQTPTHPTSPPNPPSPPRPHPTPPPPPPHHTNPAPTPHPTPPPHLTSPPPSTPPHPPTPTPPHNHNHPTLNPTPLPTFTTVNDNIIEKQMISVIQNVEWAHFPVSDSIIERTRSPYTWWRHDMKTFLVSGRFPSQRDRNADIWYHDDVIKWKHFPRYWPFMWGIHRSLVNSPHKGQ